MKIKKQVGTILSNEKGMVLPLGVIFLAIIAILGTTAVIITTTDLKIGSNYRAGEKAFYAAEAGIEEARARLRKNADDLIRIDDVLHATSDQWRRYIGTDVKAKGKGYNSSNAMHKRLPSLSDLDYVVEIKHQTDPPGGSGNVLYWGDPDGDGISQRNSDGTYSGNKNIYLVTSYGSSGSSIKVIEVEMTKVPPITAPAALYVEASTEIKGNSNIIGTDSCGSDNKPGIATTGSTGSITFNPPSLLGTNVIGTPDNASYGNTDMNVQSVVDSFKDDADFTYIVDSATDTGMSWGTPTPGATLQDPSSCSDTNIVYYNTQATSITLSGGTSGCGILLVDGDLDMHGDFSWHGLIIATGSVKFLGGGNKNITGALISGGSVDADVIGGNSNIVYCSSAIDAQTENCPLRILNWQEKM